MNKPKNCETENEVLLEVITRGEVWTGSIDSSRMYIEFVSKIKNERKKHFVSKRLKFSTRIRRCSRKERDLKTLLSIHRKEVSTFLRVPPEVEMNLCETNCGYKNLVTFIYRKKVSDREY